MFRGFEVVRSLYRFAGYFAVALFFVWRAETFVDSRGSNDLIGRLMCLALAVLLLMTGILRALDQDANAGQAA